MAKSKYEKWATQEAQTLIRGWAMDGLTDEEIYKRMGISSSTYYKWQVDHPEFSEALKMGKEVVDYGVEQSLFMAARAGNVTAMIFWLKNRRPDKWRDHPVSDSKAENGLLSDLINDLKQ